MKTIAFTGGKGGVGKTSLSCNFSIALSEIGYRTILLDADFGLANVDTVLGIRPVMTLVDLLNGARIEDVVMNTSYGISILAGSSGVTELADLDMVSTSRLIQQFGKLESSFDVMVVDTAAGISSANLALLAASDEIVLVVTPDPLSVLDSFATLKVLARRRPNIRVKVVMNMADSSEQGKSFFYRIHSVARESLNVNVEFLGAIHRDLSFRNALCSRSPLMVSNPKSSAAREVKQVASKWHASQLRSRISTVQAETEERGSFMSRLMAGLSRIDDLLARSSR